MGDFWDGLSRLIAVLCLFGLAVFGGMLVLVFLGLFAPVVAIILAVASFGIILYFGLRHLSRND